MFEALSEQLTKTFDRLTGKGVLSKKDIELALRDIRISLLESDVALPVVKSFIDQIKEEAVGEAVIRSVSPGQQIVKIVHDKLVSLLSGAVEVSSEKENQLNLSVKPPAVILMAGLQGSGKTTTSSKLGFFLKTRQKKKVLLASLDIRRPAAMEQLAQMAEKADVDSLPIFQDQTVLQIANRALETARTESYDVLILDTAGRLSIDETLMQEMETLVELANPVETLLIADSLTGQDAVETAQKFHERLPLTGLVLTRIDGDSRGGAALSMKAVTGLPIKFLGVSEKIDGLDVFDPKRLAGRILGQGDIVSLVEKATINVDQEKAEKLSKKLKKGKFDLEDLADQLGRLQKMGGLSTMLGLLPGMGKMKHKLGALAGEDNKIITHQQAIISSMTRQERSQPKVLNASRKKRIARGAGVEVSEINRLLKMYRQMSDMMKKIGKGGMKNMMEGFPDLKGQELKEESSSGSTLNNVLNLETLSSKNTLPGLGGASLPGLSAPFLSPKTKSKKKK